MKLKRIIVMMIAMIILASCSSKETMVINQNQTPYIDSKDYQYYLHEQGRGQGITESEDGYYMMNGSYLYFVDKQNMKPILLDQNPNNDCSPTNADVEPQKCSAYISVTDELYLGSIAYYDGFLYLVTQNKRTDKDAFQQKQYVLIKMNKDGSNRKVIRKFDAPPLPVIIHRDQIYFVDNISNEQPAVMTVPISSPDQEATIVYRSPKLSIPVNNLIAYKNNLYITESGDNMYRTVKLELLNNETKIIYSELEGSAAITGISEDRLYFGLYTADRNGESIVQFSSNLDGEDIKKLDINLPIINWIYADNNYFYLNPVSWYSADEHYADVPRDMVVYDSNYNEINRVDMSMVSNYGIGLVGNNQHMFIRTKENAETDKIYYIDKNKFESSKKVKIKELLESSIYIK